MLEEDGWRCKTRQNFSKSARTPNPYRTPADPIHHTTLLTAAPSCVTCPPGLEKTCDIHAFKSTSIKRSGDMRPHTNRALFQEWRRQCCCIPPDWRMAGWWECRRPEELPLVSIARMHWVCSHSLSLSLESRVLAACSVILERIPGNYKFI